MSKGGGQKSSGTQTVRNEPASFVAPFYSQAASESQNLYNTFRPEFFGGSSFVPFSPESELAMQAQTSRALGGSPLTQTAQDQQLATIRGDYLTGSPALNQELGRIAGRVNSEFAKGGGYRSSANQEILAREMADAALRNYSTERGLQQAAAFGAPALAAQDYADIAALNEVGARREDLFGRQLQDQMNRFYFEQEQDPAALDEYIRRIATLGGNFGTQNTTGTSPTAGRSVLGGAVSGLQTGLGIAGGLNKAGLIGTAGSLGPWGWGIAGLGALSGLFGD